jgi:hypothetical protein
MAGLWGDQSTGLWADQDYTPVVEMSPQSMTVNVTISSAIMSNVALEMSPSSMTVNTKITSATMYDEGKIFKSNNLVVF